MIIPSEGYHVSGQRYSLKKWHPPGQVFYQQALLTIGSLEQRLTLYEVGQLSHSEFMPDAFRFEMGHYPTAIVSTDEGYYAGFYYTTGRNCFNLGFTKKISATINFNGRIYKLDQIDKAIAECSCPADAIAVARVCEEVALTHLSWLVKGGRK